MPLVESEVFDEHKLIASRSNLCDDYGGWRRTTALATVVGTVYSVRLHPAADKAAGFPLLLPL